MLQIWNLSDRNSKANSYVKLNQENSKLFQTIFNSQTLVYAYTIQIEL